MLELPANVKFQPTPHNMRLISTTDTGGVDNIGYEEDLDELDAQIRETMALGSPGERHTDSPQLRPVNTISGCHNLPKVQTKQSIGPSTSSYPSSEEFTSKEADPPVSPTFSDDPAPAEKGWPRVFTAYCFSQKGHDLTIALSSMIVLIMTMVGVALLFSNAFGAQTVVKAKIDAFFLSIFAISTCSIWVILLLGICDKITMDNHYRDQSETTFLRGGVSCLGTGGIVYYSVYGAAFSLVPAECSSAWDIVNPIVAVCFIASELIFILKYSKLHINKSLPLAVSSRFLIAIIIATNMCVWVRTVISETMEEIKTKGEEKANFTTSANESACSKGDNLRHHVQPYTWPLLIEFCVVASTLLVAIWEKCGTGLNMQTSPGLQMNQCSISLNSYDMEIMPYEDALQYSFPSMNAARRARRQSRHSEKTRYYNNLLGFLVGWVMLVASAVLIIVYLFLVSLNQGYAMHNLESAVYTVDMIFAAVCLITVPFTMYGMSSLSFRDEELKKIKASRRLDGSALPSKKGSVQRVIDRQLLGATNLAHMAFHVMSMIAAWENGSPLIFASSFVSVVQACTQTVFINWYAMQKRATLEEHLTKKPGRQGLEVLRCGNLALWLVNTFLVKHPKAKRVHNATFGFVPWAVVSNVFQPLLILYHFHAFCCLAEVINHSYTEEYIGLVRPSKQLRSPTTSHKKFVERQFGSSDSFDAVDMAKEQSSRF